MDITALMFEMVVSLMTLKCWNAVQGLVHISASSVLKLVFPACARDKADCSDDAIDTAQAALIRAAQIVKQTIISGQDKLPRDITTILTELTTSSANFSLSSSSSGIGVVGVMACRVRPPPPPSATQ